MEFVFSLILEFIVAPLGGFIRWALFRKMTLKDYICDDILNNVGALSIFIGTTGFVYYLFSIF
jgi:hypothetical protein